MRRFWKLTDAAGATSYIGPLEDPWAQYDHATCTAEPIARLPGPHEEWDGGRWVVDPARVDDEHLAAAGRRAIDLAHARKAVEATLILAGVAVPGGLLAREAAATGQDPAALAAIVAAKSEVADAAEVRRVTAKAAMRAQNEEASDG